MSIEQKKQIIKAWRDSPITRHYSFSDKKLWAKQEKVLWAYRRNRKVAVKSGNTVGKTFCAATCALDWLTINYPSKVITTAPTWTQVEDVLWREISTLYNQSKIPFGGVLLKTELTFDTDWFAKGISTDEVYRLQGFHSPHLLVLIDEASGVIPEIWEAVESLHPEKIIAIGNPTETAGDFYECFKSSLWEKITIDCEECVAWQKKNGTIPGLVTQQWIDERKQEWGEKSALYQIHVKGEFPEQGEGVMISRKWVESARKNKIEDLEEDEIRIVHCDVATKHGTCETVIGYRYGHVQKSLQGYLNQSITDSGNRLSLLNNQKQSHFIVIDADGVGEGLGDILDSRRIANIQFHGGYAQQAIDQTKFRNLRSQFYWVVAKKFEKGMYDLTQLGEREYEILKNQLCSIKIKAPDGQGRLQVETKEDMATRGIKSPDYADCFVYGEYGFWCGKYQEVRPYAYR